LTYDEIICYDYIEETYDSVIEQLVERCKDYKSLVESLQLINKEQEKEIQELKEEHKQECVELLSKMHKLETIDYRDKYNRMRETVMSIINLVDILKEEVQFNDLRDNRNDA
jgi:hypothetical protein